MIIKNGLTFTENGRFEPLSILAKQGRITGVLAADEAARADGEMVDASGCYVLPGLMDVHVHGCAGHDFCDGKADSLEKMAEHLFSQGVTAFCPATMTLPEETLEGILRNAAVWKKRQEGCAGLQTRAELMGIHLEGPFLNPAKRGAQREDWLKMPSVELLQKWQDAAEGLIRIVTLAPELDGAMDCMERLRGLFHFSVGHSESDYETARRAFQAGADHVTHLFNAMTPFTHREPGIVGAAFDDGKCYAELICDGIHVDPSVVRMAFQLFGEDRVVLISDGMEATGMPDGEYQLGGQRVSLKGKRATLSDGTLAGSASTLYDCLKKAVEYGIPLESAIKAATVNPARSIGADDEYGSIKVGKRARFLLLDQRNLSIVRVI